MATNTTVVQGKAAKPVAAAGPWREAFGRLIKNKLAVVGLFLVGGLLFCGMRSVVKEVFDMAHLPSRFRTLDNADAVLAESVTTGR